MSARKKDPPADPVQIAKSSLSRVTDFLNFCDAVEARLAKGAVVYGNESFEAPPVLLLEELQQEALDLAGWGFVLWSRIEALKGRL